MSFIDKAKDLVAGNADKADEAVDKVADLVDEKTGGAHTDKIDAVAEKAKDVIGGLGGQ